MVWYTEFNATFWLTIAACSSAALALILKSLFKSKCKKVSCCGIFVVERDIEGELREEEIELQQNQNNPTGTPPNQEAMDHV